MDLPYGDFVYTGGKHPSSVWGFYDSRKQTYRLNQSQETRKTSKN